MRTSSLGLALALLACAAAPRRAEVLDVGDAAHVEAADLGRCRKLGPIQGNGEGGWGTSRDQQQYWARKEATRLAEEQGATNVWVTWERDDPNILTVYGVAYDCRSPAR
jgi:hypothetical protein